MFRCERPTSFEQRQRQKPACPSGFRYHPRLRRCTGTFYYILIFELNLLKIVVKIL